MTDAERDAEPIKEKITRFAAAYCLPIHREPTPAEMTCAKAYEQGALDFYDEGFAAGKAAGAWIAIAERLPTKEERDGNVILWWHEYTESAWPGEYSGYDGKHVVISMRHWHQEESLMEFTYWMIQPPGLTPPAPEGKA